MPMIGHGSPIRRMPTGANRLSRPSPGRVTLPRPTTVLQAIEAAALARAWYLAKFVPTAGQSHSDERRTARWALRGLIRQPGVSALNRPASCGLPIGNSHVAIHQGGDGIAHTSGVETCASIWSCPVCAAKIRNHRAEEIARALDGHIRAGGGAMMVTLTLPHEAADALKRTVALASDGFRAVQRGRAYAEEREAYGILGHIRAFEITHSEGHGWHPHLHVVLVTRGRTSAAGAAQLQAQWQARWDRWLKRNGWPKSAWGVGVQIARVWRPADAAQVGAYVAKVQDGKDVRKIGVGSELTRSDLKHAKAGSRAPFEILADFGTDGNAADLLLWQEYQEATKGRSAIRWSKGLRALLLPDEEDLTDEEIAAADVGGDVVAYITAQAYRRIANRPYGESYMHVAVEKGGISGLIRYVKSLGLAASAVLPPELIPRRERVVK